MKLKELIDKLIEYQLFVNIDNEPITSDILKLIKERLLECDEFKDVNSLTIIDKPIVTNTNGEVFISSTLAIHEEDNVKFKGDVYLHQINLSPLIYDPKDVHVPIKDGSSLSPLLFDPKDFTPHKEILMRYDTDEFTSDDDMPKLKKYLHEKLDKILDSPKDYSPKGKRNVLIRGVFGEWESKGVTYNKSMKIGAINPNDPPKYYMAFYLKPTQNFDEKVTSKIDMRLEKKLIPAELKDEYLKLFEKKGLSVTEEEIDGFLESHKK